jgi:hypothetical protein
MKSKPAYKFIFSFILLIVTLTLKAQVYTVQGKITNTKGDGLPYATIKVKGLQFGTTSREDGSYSLHLNAGNYHLLISAVGFKTLDFPIKVQDSLQKDIVLEEETKDLSEVVIKVKARDRAEEIMRQVIRKKDSIQSAAGNYSYQVYIKAVLLDSSNRSSSRKRINHLEKENKPQEPNLAMTEIISKVDVANGKIKEKREAVRGSRNTKGMFYLSATEGSFNFFHNLVNVPTISPVPFVSPISYNGLVAYKFKTIKIQRTGKHRVYTFSVKPLQVTNATVEGEITVSDSAWVVLHSRFRFPYYHLQEFDFFEVEQEFGFIDNQAWMLSRQQFTYSTKGRKKVFAGQTTLRYSEYKFNQQFGKKHFSTELSATAAEAYDRDSVYWGAARTEPLTEKEILFVQNEENRLRLSRTDTYLDSIDRLVNKITWQKLGFFGQSLQDHKKERVWHFSPLISLYKPFAFGGGRLNVSTFYSKTSLSRKHLSVNANASYGFRNNDVNGTVDVYRRYNPFNRGFYGISVGREFAFINDGDAWINMIKRNNFYLNNYIGAGYGLEVMNGMMISTDWQMAFRKSVAGYRTGKVMDSLLIDLMEDNQAVAFQPYNALYGKLKLQYTPAQQYRREPKEKIILGSKWPTFYVQWEKGIPQIANSAVDFDYLEFGMEQMLRMGLIGVSRYTIKTGEYFNKRDLKFIDYKFQRRGDPYLLMNPHRSFQALDSTFPVFKRFFEGHLFHEFNGLFVNKIPLLKKVQLREVGGAGFLLAPERNLRYAELYVGIERAFQSPFNPLDKFKIGVYVVSSFANQFKDPVQFKIGFTTWDKRKNRWF